MPTELLEYSPAKNEAASVPPMEKMLHLLFGKHITYSLSSVARLGVADQMGDSPVSVDELASKIEANPSALYRVLRVLAALGVFEEYPGKRFGITQLGSLLKTDAPGSIRYFAIQFGDSWSTRPFEHFADIVRSGVDGVSLAYGKHIFDLFKEEPEQAATFNRSMSQLSAGLLEPVVNAYDFGSIRRLADIGGGHGLLLASILERNPEMSGVVYDLPEVVAGAFDQPHFRRCGNRIQAEGGNFFERVPGGCDAYLLKFILHDWSDEHCKKILGCIREQLPSNGRVLLVEQIVDRTAGLSPAKLLDLEMLALTVGGRERTAEEFASLFAAAGLRLNRVVPTQSPVCVIEARLA